MRTDGRIMDAIAKIGVRYDSSYYAPLGAAPEPYDMGNGVKEVPVPFSADNDGKRITSYLWPMHEGSRTPNEFTEMADALDDGIFVIATHSWHMVETRSKGLMDPVQTKKNIGNVRDIITYILDSDFKAVRIAETIGPRMCGCVKVLTPQ
jgi:hypothetical protein